MNSCSPLSLIQTGLVIQPMQYLNITFDKGYIYALNHLIRANVFDVFAFSVALIGFSYLYIKIFEEDPESLHRDHPITRPLKFFNIATPLIFDWLKWILILSVFLAAAQETKSRVFELVYMISFSSLILYIMDYSVLFLRKLIYKMPQSFVGMLSNRVFFGLLIPFFIFISFMISWLIQIITDILIRLR